MCVMRLFVPLQSFQFRVYYPFFSFPWQTLMWEAIFYFFVIFLQTTPRFVYVYVVVSCMCCEKSNVILSNSICVFVSKTDGHKMDFQNSICQKCFLFKTEDSWFEKIDVKILNEFNKSWKNFSILRSGSMEIQNFLRGPEYLKHFWVLTHFLSSVKRNS